MCGVGGVRSCVCGVGGVRSCVCGVLGIMCMVLVVSGVVYMALVVSGVVCMVLVVSAPKFKCPNWCIVLVVIHMNRMFGTEKCLLRYTSLLLSVGVIL